MVDQNQFFREDGSFNFKKREERDYSHSHSYMAGWLGQEKVLEEKKRRRKLGKVEMVPPMIPLDKSLIETIERTAKCVHQSSDPDIFERMIREKNKGKPGWGFIEEGAEGHDYYKFCRHCCERETDPRPHAMEARKIAEDREIKMRNVQNNTFVASSGAPSKEPVRKDPVFRNNELMEVLGIKNKPDYNGNIVRVIKYHPDVDRYEVVFIGGRYNTVVVKLKEENLMYSAVVQRDMKEEEMVEGEIPNGTRVEIRGLMSDAAKWMNGQKGTVVQWDKDGERYEVRLDCNNDVKKIKAQCIRAELPEGWEEYYDEHLSRSYYLNTKTQKITWKHPTVANQRGKMGVVREHNAEEIDEVEIDVDRKQYEVDEEEELEGGFNLQQLVRKVEEQEERREAAEEAGISDVDSDDGMHRVAKKPRKKKKPMATVEALQEKLLRLTEETMVARETMMKDFTLLEGNFIATTELDPILKKWEAFEGIDEEPPPALLRATFETVIVLLTKGAQLMTQLRRSKLQINETNKRIDMLVALKSPDELLEVAKWVSALLKTM